MRVVCAGVSLIFFCSVSFCIGTTLTGKLDDQNDGLETENHRETRIKGGGSAKITKFPFVMSIYNAYEAYGTGFILNERWAITAALHVKLFRNDTMKFRVGSQFTDRGGESVYADSFYIHPKYHSRWTDDVALIKLTRPLNFTEEIKPISIGSKLPRKGAKVTVAGFGESVYMSDSNLNERNAGNNILKSVEVAYTPYAICKKLYPAENQINKAIFCTRTHNKGPCRNDWGAPVIYRKKAIGLFVGAKDCASVDKPPLYLDLTKYTKWIKSVIRKHSKPSEMAEEY